MVRPGRPGRLPPMFPDIVKHPKGGDVVVSDELLEDLEHGRGLTEAAISDRTQGGLHLRVRPVRAVGGAPQARLPADHTSDRRDVSGASEQAWRVASDTC